MVWLSTEADDQSSVHCVIVLTDERGWLRRTGLTAAVLQLSVSLARTDLAKMPNSRPESFY